MTAIKGRAPHADTDPRRGPDLEHENIPEGLRRERKAAYGPATGRHDESVEPDGSRHAKDRHIAEDK